MPSLSLPLDRNAIRVTDDEFYSRHPGLIDSDGNRIPIHPTSAEYADERQEWLNLYKKHSKQEEEPATKTTPPGETIACCPAKEKVLLYLLFYVTKNHHGDSLFAESAQTRLQNIKASNGYDDKKHKVHCPPIQDLGEIATIVSRYIARYGGKEIAFCKEVGVFSHSALQGPIGSQPTTVDPTDTFQMAPSGWGKIEFNWWKDQPLFTAYGCNSGNENFGEEMSFAKNLSVLPNFADVEVWGQSTSSFPSFFPDVRWTSAARSWEIGRDGMGWDVGETYQVGGNKGEGRKAILPWDSKSVLKANPLNCYKNGAKIRSTHQGFYNDHRKVFTMVAV